MNRNELFKRLEKCAHVDKMCVEKQSVSSPRKN